MKYKFFIALTFIFLLFGCSPEEQLDSEENVENDALISETNEEEESTEVIDENEGEEDSMHQLQFNIGNETFNAFLYDSETTSALVDQLPLSMTMTDLHNNEKYYDLEEPLPTQSERVNSISKGDLMLFGSSTLVLFYEDFSTSYSYTRLGYIEDPDQLEAVVGTGHIDVNIQLVN